jgi:hypothetical protein
MPVAFDPQTPPGTTNITDFLASYGAGGGGGIPAAGLPTGGLVAPDVPRVYMGRTRATFPGAGEATPRGFGSQTYKVKGVTKESTLEQAMAKFDNMSFSEQRNILRLLAIAGFAGPMTLDSIDDYVNAASQGDAREAYSLLLETASDYYMNSNRAVTPNDVLRSAVAYRLDAYGVNWDGNFDTFKGGVPKAMAKAAAESGGGAASGYDPADFPYKKTTTSKSIDVLNPKDAKALTRAVLQQELGRDPTQGEYEDFLSALNAAERENPDISRTTTTYKLDPVTEGPYVAKQRTVTEQGIGEAGLSQVAYEKAQRNPNWAEWQAMGTYFPALLSALGSTTGV